MRAPLLTAALVATSAAACPTPLQTGPCASAVDCRLNGACDAGKCRCDRGWGGQYCQLLQLGPGSTAYGTLGTTSAWGGGPPYWSAETASYHLFATELAAHCGMAVWGRMSQAVHAVSKTLLGPYTRVATALPTDTHNVYHQYSSADRTHVIYHIGTSENPPSCNPYLKCTNGSTPGAHSLTPPANWTKSTCPDTSAAPRMHWSKSVDGPWTMAPLRLATIPWLASHGSHNGGTSHQTSNPAPLILDNGTVLLMARSANQMVINGTKQHYPEVWLFRADSWNGTYEFLPGDSTNGALCIGGFGEHGMQTEDPVLWKGRRGYHALFHQNLTHAWSEDGVSDWHWSNEATATTEVRREDGTLVVRTDHERPRVSLTEDGDLAAVFVASSAHQTATSDDAQLLVYETVQRPIHV